MKTKSFPMVSIVMPCRNSAPTIRICVESVLSQEYPNLEFIIQDGLSTDGTLEILKEYGHCLQPVSEPDSGPEDGLSRALSRCKGEIICMTCADEALMPGAVDWAVTFLSKNKEIKAVYGDYHSMNLSGDIIDDHVGPEPFSIEKYLAHEIIPHYGSTFFRRSCIGDISMDSKEWSHGGGEFLFWVTFGAKGQARYHKGFVSKSWNGSGRRSDRADVLLDLVKNRIVIMDDLFKPDQLLFPYSYMREKAYSGLHMWAAIPLIQSGAFEEARDLVINAFSYQEPQKIEHSHFRTFILPKLYQHGANLLLEGSPQKALPFLDLCEMAQVVFPDVHLVRAIGLKMMNEDEKAQELITKNRTVEENFPQGEGALRVRHELAKTLKSVIRRHKELLPEC